VASHYEDEAEVENLKRWWKENWKSLAAGLIIGLGGIGGYEGYRRYNQAQAERASQIYEDLKAAVTNKKVDEAIAAGDNLIRDYAKTPYATGAALRLAQLAVEQGKLDDAATRLQWVAGNSKDDGMRDLAKLRLARVLWQQKKPDDALEQLDGQSGAYGALASELRGDIKLAQGDRTAARAAYEAAVKASAADADTGNLQRKLDELADVVNS
jgi:predicted negative regulator of RcsB-dependent stress response